jgi:prepilin-type processing-associated H-X9-DG protein/prepilin-type N-terminal cleavage/methylation domain-containing protein
MNPRVSHQKTAAMTLVEVLVVVAVLAVLAALLLPALGAARRKARLITCNGELKCIGLSFRIWEGDHTNLYPMRVSTNFGGTLEYVERGEMFRHFQVMSNELATPKMVICPSDTRQPAKDFCQAFGNTNISYFVGVDSVEPQPPTYLTAQMLLSGDRNLVGGTKLASRILEITTNQTVGWSSEMHNGRGNIGLADGSVATVGDSGLINLLHQTGVATNRLAIP